MVALDALLIVAAAFLAPQAAVLALNLAAFPVLRVRTRPHAAAAAPRVSILVPVRDEERNLPHTLPRLLEQGAHEVLVLDDASEDATADIVRAHAADRRDLRVLQGAPLPPGWTGKAWACHQLAQRATGDVWLFTDADVRWEPGALDAVTAFRSDAGAGLATVWPRQVTGTRFERCVVPVVDLLLLGCLPHPLVRRSPAPALAAANGQVMLFTPEAYARSGGHAAVRSEVLEDVRLAQRAKAAGVRLALALGGDAVWARMYRGRREVIEGFAKNVLPAAGGSRPVLLALAAVNTLAYALAWPLALLDPRWLAVGALGVGMRAAAARKTGRPPADGWLQPLFPAGLWPIALRAVMRRGAYTWKGRRSQGGTNRGTPP